MQKGADRRASSAIGSACFVLGLSLANDVALAQSESIRITPALSAQATWTNNVDVRAGAEKRSDFVLEISPRLRVDIRRPRAELVGNISAPAIIYANTSSESYVQPQASLSGRIEAIENFFFVDGAASVSPQYFSPFGARPEGSATITDNRYTASSYRVSPFIEGRVSNNIRYTVRDDNIWTGANSSPAGSQYFYTNRLTAAVHRDPTPLGWSIELDSSEYDFRQAVEKQKVQHARGRVTYEPDPQLRVFVTAGYERNRFPLNEVEGATYGVGASWRPTPRTKLEALWEHRFFGGSYSFVFDHRTRLTSWSVRASRDLSSYPQQVATLGTVGSVPGLLNDLFLARFPDPIDRARAVDAYVNEHGLPQTLAEPLALFAQRITLQESVVGALGLLGVRNSVLLSIFRSRSEDISGTGEAFPLAPGAFGRNVVQLGASASWSHRLTPVSTLTLIGTVVRSESQELSTGETDTRSVRMIVNRPLSPRTSAFAGARYQHQDSGIERGFDEFAAFVGVSHTFR